MKLPSASDSDPFRSAQNLPTLSKYDEQARDLLRICTFCCKYATSVSSIKKRQFLRMKASTLAKWCKYFTSSSYFSVDLL